jgi:hypothetical protein
MILQIVRQRRPERERFIVIPPIARSLKKVIANGEKNFNVQRKKEAEVGRGGIEPSTQGFSICHGLWEPIVAESLLLDFGQLERFLFEREDIPVPVDRDKAAGRSRREHPCRKRSAYSGLPAERPAPSLGDHQDRPSKGRDTLRCTLL